MNRVEVVKFLIEMRGYKRYLEIGCQNNVCFDQIDGSALDLKIGVDPVSGGTHKMTSDAFFEFHARRYPRQHHSDIGGPKTTEGPGHFDLVFVDGDHHHAQALRDAENALAVLAPGGCLVMHDVLPKNAIYEGPLWCGTAWRAFAKLREDATLDGVAGDFDHGVGVIRKGPNPEPIVLGKGIDLLTYADFVAHRDSWMRPVEFEDLCAIIEGWPAQ